MTDNLHAWATRWGCPPAMYQELVAIVTHTDDMVRDVTHGRSEAAVQQELRCAAPQMGFALWRNNNGACMDDTGRQIRYGLGNDSKKLNQKWKSSDLIGIGPGGKFMAVEVKAPGWTKPANARDRAQAAFNGTVSAMGGISGFATSISDLEGILKNGS